MGSWRDELEIGIVIQTLLCVKQITNENLTAQHRELCSMLCGDSNGKGIPKRGDICVTDSLCSTAGTNSTL